MSDEVTLQAGRVGPHRESHEERLNIKNFLAPGVTPLDGYIEWDGTKSIGPNQWGMDNNDDWSDCGFAAVDHYNVAKMGDITQVGMTLFPTFKTLLDAYWAYGLAWGEVGQPPNQPDQPDDGVDNSTMMGWLYKLGLIEGYAEVPLDSLDWFAMNFQGVVLGLVIDGNVASADFNANPRRPWDVMGKGDGHDTLGIVTHSDGSGALVTWGGLQPYTLAFRENNITDAWVILDKNDPWVNWGALSAALTDIHGTVVPVDPTPPVISGPASTSVPPKAVEGELARLAQAVEKSVGNIAADLHRAIDVALEHESVDVALEVLKAIVKRYE